MAVAGGGLVAATLAPERAEAHHLCGHTFTTGSCPHPFAPYSRVDKWGYPVHPEYGYPVDDDGNIYLSREQSRRRICQDVVPEQYPKTRKPKYGGGWSRCCGGRIRHIQDCCSRHDIRINGDRAVRGYCRRGLKVFCITYQEFDLTC